MQAISKIDVNGNDIYDKDIIQITAERSTWKEIVDINNLSWLYQEWSNEYGEPTYKILGNTIKNTELIKK